MRQHLRPARALIAATASLSLACKSDQSISEIAFDFVAVTTGDFDEVEETLDRNDIASDLYEGFIYAPVYSDDIEADDIAFKAEQLFTGIDEDGEPLLYRYPAAFVNSGTRGLGKYVYNGVDADDGLVSDPEVVARVQDYLERNRVLVVSDWAYDLVEAAFPDRISFLNEDEGYDSAQVGYDDSVVATVEDEGLAEVLESDQLEVFFDFSYWTVMESVASGVDVYLRGDVTYRAEAGEGYATLEDVPLLVAFDQGRGRVIMSAFAWRAQRSWVTDQILAYLIEGFDPSSNGAADE